MRRPIGWVDKTWPGGKRSVRVEFFAETFHWRFRTPEDEEWQDGKPTEDNWNDLEAKILELIQRGHIFAHELALVRKARTELPASAATVSQEQKTNFGPALRTARARTARPR